MGEGVLLNLGWRLNLYRIDRTQDGSWLACGPRGILLINTGEEEWRSCTERLPENLIHLSRDILAARKGVTAPDREVVMVAHYDSYSDEPLHYAPGAMITPPEPARFWRPQGFAGSTRSAPP
ncbi:MAG TPA: hypothetical protein PK843_05100 [bacterium]|nr:hypothetical protein [bacterium]